jgi:hypothetical protein
MMVKRIDSLTDEQKSKFSEWSKKWIDIGLSTEPADFDKATEAAFKEYKLINLDKPMVVLRMSSPYAETVGGAMAWQMLKDLLKGSAQVGDQVWAQVGDQNFQAAKDGFNNYGADFSWAGFAAWVSFFRDVCGWENEVLSKFEITEQLVKSCGWTWWHQNVLAISDHPSKISRDVNGRLHCENGPSIEYRDGWALYHWHGTSIPKEWVTGHKPSAKEALTWGNIEQRRAACEIVGWSSIMQELDAKTIDVDGDPEIGTLLEANIPDSGKERFLQVRCGTGRDFVLPVPRDMQTAIQANAWTWGLDAEQYKPEVRT